MSDVLGGFNGYVRTWLSKRRIDLKTIANQQTGQALSDQTRITRKQKYC